MTISVIVPTYNGAEKLPQVLDALLTQSVSSFQLIFAIDGSTDNSVDIIKAYHTKFGNLQIIRQHNRGRAAIRNAGAKAATGDLLIFFDDDMRPEPHCIIEHMQHHLKFSNSILTGAQIDDFATAISDFQKYKCTISRRWVLPLLKYEGKPLPLANLYLTAANCSMPKQLFSTLDGFDENLRDAEDFDLAIRAFQAGIPIYYCHNAFAWHDDFVTPFSYVRRLREYQKAHRELRQLKPGLYKNIQLREVQAPAGIKKLAFSFFSHSLWLRFISSNAVAILPKKIRFRLYDLVTTSLGVFNTNKPL